MNETVTLTVSQLNEYVKLLIDSQPVFRRLYICGEISNFTDHYSSGHLYFTLKDENSRVRAVMFAGNASRLRFRPENGMRVVVRGSISVYERDGQYQLYADDIQPDGVGSLAVAFEQLKRRLEKEGLFSQERKKPLPGFPERIGVITSATGAAVRDIINVTGRRYPLAEIVLYPALVQGDGAAESIIAGIKYFNDRKNADVLIVGRGGGSVEDLWAFNDEALARCVAGSEIPVISAVGHETDFTVCDFAADVRAATPSAAAELAVPDIAELESAFSGTGYSLDASISRRLRQFREELKSQADSVGLRNPQSILRNFSMRALNIAGGFESAADRRLNTVRNGLREQAARLTGLNPLSVLARGYAAVSDETGAPVLCAEGLEVGQKLNIRFSDGSIKAEIIG